MRELLIRYLLGELDVGEHERLHAELQRNADLRAELARLRACIAAKPQGDEFSAEPPGDLVARVAQEIAGCGEVASDSVSASRRAATLAAIAEPPAGVLGWSLADLTVAGGVVLAVSMLLFPALRDSRDGTRLNLCGNNLRELYVPISVYADNHHGFLPQSEAREPAGMFVARLLEAGFHPDDLRLWLMCPASAVADQLRAEPSTMQTPTVAEYRAMTAAEAARIGKWLSPCYAMRVGYRDARGYHRARIERSPRYALISDSPSDEQKSRMSLNHGGHVAQVLCGDGRVRIYTTTVIPELNGDLFLNDAGKVDVGCTPQDCVLGRSEVKLVSEIDAIPLD